MLAKMMLGPLCFTSLNQSRNPPMLSYNVGKKVNSLNLTQACDKKTLKKQQKARTQHITNTVFFLE